MTAKTYLTPKQAAVLRAAAEGLEQGHTVRDCALRAGIGKQAFHNFLFRLLGTARWPAPLAEIEALLKLPVISVEEAVKRGNGLRRQYDDLDRWRCGEMAKMIDAGMNKKSVAAALGLRPSGVTALLARAFPGNYGWPPRAEDLRRFSENGECKRPPKSFKGTMGAEWGGAKLSDHEIAQRREQVAQERAERERNLLAEEQRKYGLKRMGKPLSEMVA